MQVDKLVISTKARNSWQCFDLGCRVAIANFRQLFLFWLVVTFPIFIVCILISPMYGLLVFWLLKPWYERGQLYILSRTIFGNKVSVIETIKAWPSQIKPLWFSSVTYRRLAPSRSFDVAVAQLEGLTKTRRAERLHVLHANSDNNTFWWTFACVHWESFIAMALLVIVKMLLPQEFDHISIFDIFNDNSVYVEHLLNISYYIAIALVAPFYVAGGFIAYLNRRITLEGWDIEIGFKHWQKEFLTKHVNTQHTSTKSAKSPSQGLSSVAIVATLLFSLHVVSSQPAIAHSQSDQTQSDQTQSNQTQSDQNTQQEIEILNPSTSMMDLIDQNASTDIEAPQLKNQALRDNINSDIDNILNNEPFGGTETVTGYRFRQSEDDDEDEEETTSNSALGKFFIGFASFIAASIEIIFWGLLIFIVVYFVYRNRQLIANLFDTSTVKIDDVPLPSFISKAFSEKLPDDVLESVNIAIDANDYRRALSLLVRASLTKLSQENRVRISKGMTENECLLALKQSIADDVFLFMKQLMQAWMTMAWAHQLPTTETLNALSHDYKTYFVDEPTQALENSPKGDQQ